MSEPTIKELQEQIVALQQELKKQKSILTKTTTELLQMQVNAAKKQMDAIPNPTTVMANATANFDPADFATNDDLVQLVGELQGQLQLLDDKSLLRVKNSHATNANEEYQLTPLPNEDGTLPPLDLFPKNVAEFVDLGDDQTVELGRFYGLVTKTEEEQAKLELYLEGKSDSMTLNGEELMGAEGLDEDAVKNIWSDLAIFLGLGHLKRDEEL
ncbi:Mrp8 protein [Martiniozyma asiatica (nom. inval.)]|nr:Mrp8 protein [Martiniozyma asiatica]